MSNANDDLLWYEAPNRTQAQLTAGLAAAHRSLTSAGVTIDGAYRASWKPEALEHSGKRMSAGDWELFEAWNSAVDAADEAAGLSAARFEAGRLFPAALGIERNADMQATIAKGGDVYPEPDYGPFFTVAAPIGVEA